MSDNEKDPVDTVEQLKEKVRASERRTNHAASIYDVEFDISDIEKMSPRQRAEYFPNDFGPGGEPYGDF